MDALVGSGYRRTRTQTRIDDRDREQGSSMSGEVYVYEAISIEPPIEESEAAVKVAAGAYTKVVWDDPRIGEGYFLRVGATGLIGICFVPVAAEDGSAAELGVAVQADPLAEEHRDATIESELQAVLSDFGTAPGGVKRLFDGALYIERPDGEEKIVVRGGEPVRLNAQ